MSARAKSPVTIWLPTPSVVGRGPAAALGVGAIALVAAGTQTATSMASSSGSAVFPV